MPRHRHASSPARFRTLRRRLALASLMVTGVVSLAQPGGATDAPAAIPASRQADNVAVITVNGPIDRLTSISVQRRLKEAADAGADALVFEINSPGGEIGAVLEISAAIKSSPIPNTVAWVNPMAYSGGAIIALACREIVNSNPAAMGDAFPVTFGSEGLRALTPDQRTKLLPPLLQDVTDSARRNGYDEFLVQVMVTDGIELWAARDTRTGRLLVINEDEYIALFGESPKRGSPILGSVPGARTRSLAERAARQNTDAQPATDEPPVEEHAQAPPPAPRDPLLDPDDRTESKFTPAGPAVADLQQNVTDLLDVTTNRPDVSTLNPSDWEPAGYVTDGTSAVVLGADQLADFGLSSATIKNDQELMAFFGAKNLIRLDQSWSETLVGYLTSIPARGILIVVFLLALFIEMTSPGMIVPGGVAVVALVALIAPPMLVGMAGWWELGAIVLGILLLALEILVIPGFGVFGVLGLLLLFGGLVGTFVPSSPGFPGMPGRGTDLLYGVVTVALATATAGVGMYFITKHFGRLPLVSRLVLADATPDEDASMRLDLLMATDAPTLSQGDTGRALSSLRPSGTAEFNDQVVDVVSDMGYIDPGTPIRVLKIDGYRVVVEPIDADHGGDHA
ncbi:MAG: NfeD family protein [Phycisphaerales bacterium]